MSAKILKTTFWSAFGSGSAINVENSKGELVRIIAKGNGQYAKDQRKPEGYSEQELIEIADGKAPSTRLTSSSCIALSVAHKTS